MLSVTILASSTPFACHQHCYSMMYISSPFLSVSWSDYADSYIQITLQHPATFSLAATIFIARRRYTNNIKAISKTTLDMLDFAASPLVTSLAYLTRLYRFLYRGVNIYESDYGINHGIWRLDQLIESDDQLQPPARA